MTARQIGTACGDCGVAVGQTHVDGCDVARCTECGWQRIGCEHDHSDEGWGAVWTGEWPGHAECRELGLFVDEGEVPMVSAGESDLNRLAQLSAAGYLRWDRDLERWVKADDRPLPPKRRRSWVRS